jgi:hypothetical protein
MTREAYLEMCETLGTEPNPDEIPTEFSDFPELVQQVITIYYLLTDRWEGMSGTYLGKDLTIVFNLFEMYHLDKQEQLLALQLIQLLDKIRSQLIDAKQAQKTPKP